MAGSARSAVSEIIAFKYIVRGDFYGFETAREE